MLRQRVELNSGKLKVLAYLMIGMLAIAAVPRSLAVEPPPPPAAASEPFFKAAPDWPRKLPNDWTLGVISGVAVDQRGHVWINHLTIVLGADTDAARQGLAGKPDNYAPPIVEFDQDGNFVRGWGGPGPGYDWPTYPHGLFVDHKGFVWIGGNNQNDRQLLKFTSEGKFVAQLGRVGAASGALKTRQLGRAANFFVDARTNELYVADGYGNRRIIVFDADTLKFKRMWGAYGNPPVDPAPDALSNFYHSDPHDPQDQPPPHFNSPVHCVGVTTDRLVYVCDRTNNRVQVFHTDGRFVREFFLDRDSPANGLMVKGGAPTDVAFWPDANQTYLLVGDANNKEVVVMQRRDGKLVSRFGQPGHGPGQFHLLHMMAIDSNGNLYTGDVDKRVQKWIPQPGVAPPTR